MITDDQLISLVVVILVWASVMIIVIWYNISLCYSRIVNALMLLVEAVGKIPWKHH